MKIPGWRSRLLASTRGKIISALRTQSYTVQELAETLGLTDNAVRSHLTSLERDGLIQQLGTQPGFRKPHVLYSLTSEAESLFQNAYAPLLRYILEVIERRLPSSELRQSLREVGQRAAREHLNRVKGKTRIERIEFAIEVLKNLGGNPNVREIEGKQFICGNNCPLSAATTHSPEACLIVESLLSEVIGNPVKECCQHEETPRCCFEIS